MAENSTTSLTISKIISAIKHIIDIMDERVQGWLNSRDIKRTGDSAGTLESVKSYGVGEEKINNVVFVEGGI
jgi:hypothetical protein